MINWSKCDEESDLCGKIGNIYVDVIRNNAGIWYVLIDGNKYEERFLEREDAKRFIEKKFEPPMIFKMV